MAKNYIRKLDYAVLVEGQMDLIMSHQTGILNTVASSGTALTELHLKKNTKAFRTSDYSLRCGFSRQKASWRAAELALGLGMEIKIVSLPKGRRSGFDSQKDQKRMERGL